MEHFLYDTSPLYIISAFIQSVVGDPLSFELYIWSLYLFSCDFHRLFHHWFSLSTPWHGILASLLVTVGSKSQVLRSICSQSRFPHLIPNPSHMSCLSL